MSSNTSKVSFSVQSKQVSSKSNSKSSTRNLKATTHQDDDELQTTTKQFVTEFDPNETLSHSKPQRIIIPRKPDECRPTKKMKNLDIVLSQSNNPSDRLQFEIDSKPDADAATAKVSYGLTLRSINNAASVSEPVENSGGLLKDVKLDMDTLPEDQGFREFDDMPVEDFGAALLSGLGWFKGRGIGKNPKGDVEIKQVEKKTFAPDEPNIGSIAKKDKERDGFSVGKHVNSKHQDKDTKVKHQESEIQQRVDKRSRDSDKREKRDGNDRKDRVSWLRSHIRVRIISKELKRGRLYLKKGEVVDVVGPNTCDISIDESGELVQGVDQDLLETALPKRGGPVLVLNGRHKGVYGNLVERDLDRETGVVRDADSHELLNVKLEQIAEYIGDPSYIGY